nr:hypothetical protein CFP56_47925 [Quercus suber]
MPRLEEWKDAKELTSASEVLVVFPCLAKLFLLYCRELRYLPGVPSVIQHLEIIGCDIDELPSGLQFCTSLQYLKIDCPNLKSIPDLGEVFHSLINLKLSNCPDLRLKLSQREGCLKPLVIGGFIEELDAFPILRYPFIRYSHTSLKKLRLHGRPTLNFLPNEIQLFTALEEMRIQKFNGMEALLDWLSLIEKRCVEGSGAEWFQISHIPNIKINGKYIKGKDLEDSGDFDDYDESEYVEFDDSEDDRDDYKCTYTWTTTCKKIPSGKMIKWMITDAKVNHIRYARTIFQTFED